MNSLIFLGPKQVMLWLLLLLPKENPKTLNPKPWMGGTLIGPSSLFWFAMGFLALPNYSLTLSRVFLCVKHGVEEMGSSIFAKGGVV